MRSVLCYRLRLKVESGNIFFNSFLFNIQHINHGGQMKNIKIHSQETRDYLRTYGWMFTILTCLLGALFLAPAQSSEAVSFSSNDKNIILKYGRIATVAGANLINLVLQNSSGGRIRITGISTNGTFMNWTNAVINRQTSFPMKIPAGQEFRIAGLYAANTPQQSGSIDVNYIDAFSKERNARISGSGNIVPKTGLVALYHFARSAWDSSGNNNHGREYGNTNFEGHTANFFAKGDYIDCGDNPVLSISDNISISFWFFPRQFVPGHATHPINKWRDANINYVFYFFGKTSGMQGNIGFFANSGGTFSSVSSSYIVSNLNQWYHVAWTYNSAIGGILYVNGMPTGNPVGAGMLATTPADMFIEDEGLDGAMDEVMIFNRVLSPQDIKELYDSAPIPFEPVREKKPLAPQELPPLPELKPRPVVVKISTGAPQLFVDDYLIQSQTNLFRRLGQVDKYSGSPVISPDKPWEVCTAFPYGGGAIRLADDRWVILYQTYRRWLRGGERTSVCYATSTDGLRWEKPTLNLFEVAGTKRNNVVLSFDFNNFTALYDRDDPDANRCYKAAVYTGGEEGDGLYGYTSPDGVHWTRMARALLPEAGDRSTLWYDTIRKKYVIFTRYYPIYRGRQIFQSESKDFVEWTQPQLILHNTLKDNAHEIDHYGANGFVYGDMYLGFLEIYHEPYRRIDTQLICSRDGRAWSRVCEGEVFLGNGPEETFDQFWAFPAGTPPIRVGNELWIYYSGHRHPHSPPQPPIWPGGKPGESPRYAYWAATGLATMRVDGFAAMDAAGSEAQLITVPFQFDKGSDLRINANTKRFPPGSSWLKVAVLDKDLNPLPGFGIDDFEVMIKDSVDHLARWKGRSDLSALAGKPIRLDFRLVNTRLYSFTVK